MAFAEDAHAFQAGRIIDDAIFTNNSSMSAADIQSFLNTKNSTCLKNYNGAGWAAGVIKQHADAFGINPKVLLVTLQKEQGLITRADCPQWRYDTAMGFGCPDGSPCDPNYFGFERQVYQGARHFRGFYDQAPGWYIPYRPGERYIQWNPSSLCGGSYINIVNRATASLYSYTPYQPNAAALSNLYGTGDPCSAYGNRNFWRDFRDWFGSTLGQEYAWSLTWISYGNGSPNTPVGSSQTVVVTVVNRGTVTWTNAAGATPVRLGIWGTSGSTDPGTWVGPMRPATLDQVSLAPGETGTFTFTAKSPSPGMIIERVNLLIEGQTWFPDVGASYSVYGYNYAWSLNSINYSSLVPLGGAATVTVKATNTGQSTWTKDGPYPIRIGISGTSGSTADSSWLAPDRPATLQEASVAPGGVGTFAFRARAPSITAVSDHLNLIAEGLVWLNDPGAGSTYTITGYDYRWTLKSISHSLGTAVTGIDQTQTVTVTAQNTGQSTWSAAGTYPVKLGIYGSSGATNSGWATPNRPAGLSANVAPGGTATFSFNVRAPYVGEFFERVNLVAEGLAWAPDVGALYYLRGVNPFSWQLQSVSHSTGTALMNVGSTQTITIKAKNTGTNSWDKAGTYPVRLGIWGSSGATNGGGWLAANRPATFDEPGPIAPGGTATFTFTVTAPHAGEFFERVNLLAEGLTWAPDLGALYYLNGR